MQSSEKVAQMIENVERVMIGKTTEIRLVFVALLAGGHVLLEDVPGVGKTMFVKAVARTIGGSFKRIQFTPDLLPSDVTGFSFYNQHHGQFEFRPGPIMGNVVLADEVNRTSPKTQAALLEALEEGYVTVDGTTRQIEAPFFVMATQNPIEYAGTFPLPEAQLDRFLLKIAVGYPTFTEELALLDRVMHEHPIAALESVMTPEDIVHLQRAVKHVYLAEEVKSYLVQIIQATRFDPHIELGASPRAAIALMRVSQAYAFSMGRTYVKPDDVKEVTPYVLNHRIRLKQERRHREMRPETVIEQLLAQIEVPVMIKEKVSL